MMMMMIMNRGANNYSAALAKTCSLCACVCQCVCQCVCVRVCVVAGYPQLCGGERHAIPFQMKWDSNTIISSPILGGLLCL